MTATLAPRMGRIARVAMVAMVAMVARIAMVAAIATLVMAAPAARAETAEPQLVIVDLSPGPLPAPYDGLDLAADVAHTVAAESCAVHGTCRGAGCAAGLPPGPARQLVTVAISYDVQAYSCAVVVELRFGPGRPLVYVERAASPVCPAADALEHARGAARVACQELRKELAAAPHTAAPPPAPLSRLSSSGGVPPAPAGTSPAAPTGASPAALTDASPAGLAGASPTARSSAAPPALTAAAARPPAPAALPPRPRPPAAPPPLPPPWPAPGRDPGPPSRLLPLAAVGAGAAAMLAGGVLLYLDGRPTSCASSPDGERRCAELLDTTHVGIPLVLLGAASAGWGAWQLGQPPPSPTAAIAVARGRLLLQGRF
jgi:hypothetical protein